MASLSRFLQTRFQADFKSFSLFLAVYDGDPLQDGTGGTELTNDILGTSVRTAITFSADVQEVIGTKSSVLAVTITNSSQNVSDVTMDNVAVFDASTGGNLLVFGPLPSPQVIEPGRSVIVPDEMLNLLFK